MLVLAIILMIMVEIIATKTMIIITIIIIIKHRQKAMKTAPIPEARPVRESSLRNIV